MQFQLYFISFSLSAFTYISFSFHPFKNVISGFLSLLSPLIFQYFPFLSFSVHLSVCLSLLSGPMMSGRTDQWSMNKTKDSSMPDSFLGPLYFFNLCVFFNLPLCSWQHSESDSVWLSEVFMLSCACFMSCSSAHYTSLYVKENQALWEIKTGDSLMECKTNTKSTLSQDVTV